MAPIKKDVVQRGELYLYFMGNIRVVMGWAKKNYNLKGTEIDLLFYLQTIVMFNRQDFIDGSLLYSWNKKRLYMLKKEGWVHKVHVAQKWTTDTDKYALTTKANTMLNRIYRMLIGTEEIPESARRNNIMKRETYSDKVLSTSIKRVNRRKDDLKV